MAARWLENIRRTHQLSVFPGSSLTGSWPAVFNNALQEFNNLSNTHRLGVTLVRSGVPVNRFLTGANVQVEATDTAKTFNDTSHGPQTITLGSIDDARTRPLPTGSTDGRLVQALICLRASPKVTAGPTGQATVREAGDPIKLVILIHELIHACGLDNPDHTAFSNPDLFVAVLTPHADASDPAKDREEVGTKNAIPILTPPLFLSAQTVASIQFLWLVPNPVILHFPHTF